MNITMTEKLPVNLFRFFFFVQSKDGHSGYLSFRDSAGFLGREEDYKSRIAEEARKEMNFKSWKKSWIGTGKIAECARRAMDRSGNLVNINQRFDFINRLDPQNPKYREKAEQVLYDIYRNPDCDESIAFSKAVEVFGAKYDTISFLFFIKDDSRFLPISPSHFDKGFKALDIDYTTSYRCSWENYKGFIDIIKELRLAIENNLPMKGTPRLIDAHSFVWIIQGKKYNEWIPDAETEIQIEDFVEAYYESTVSGTGGKSKAQNSRYNRDSEVIKVTKSRAKGICQYCNQPAPFRDKKGVPYLEVHHIVWLSRDGKDSTDNTVALCPNCHRRMHVLDLSEDVNKLLELKRKNY